jgi:hypothetical protein
MQTSARSSRLLCAPLLPLTARWALCAALTAGCAESHPDPLQPTKVELSQPAQQQAQQQAQARRPFDPGAWVAMQDAARDCEQSARSIRKDNPEEGWQAMRACVEKGKFARGAKFVELEQVVNNWASELTARPDAPSLLAQLIANRGGDTDGDLVQLQDNRVPLFTLSAAMQQPAVYKGRLILLRAQVRTTKLPDEKAPSTPGVTLVLDESAFQTVRAQNTRVLGSGYKATPFSSGYHEERDVTDNNNNASRPTGRSVLGRMPEADPFLQTQRDFLFLARFDGVAKEEARTVAVVTLIKYFAPKAMLVQ